MTNVIQMSDLINMVNRSMTKDGVVTSGEHELEHGKDFDRSGVVGDGDEPLTTGEHELLHGEDFDDSGVIGDGNDVMSDTEHDMAHAPHVHMHFDMDDGRGVDVDGVIVVDGDDAEEVDCPDDMFRTDGEHSNRFLRDSLSESADDLQYEQFDEVLDDEESANFLDPMVAYEAEDERVDDGLASFDYGHRNERQRPMDISAFSFTGNSGADNRYTQSRFGDNPLPGLDDIAENSKSVKSKIAEMETRGLFEAVACLSSTDAKIMRGAFKKIADGRYDKLSESEIYGLASAFINTVCVGDKASVVRLHEMAQSILGSSKLLNEFKAFKKR